MDIDIVAYAMAAIVLGCVLVGFKRAGYERSGRGYPLLLASFPLYYWVFALYAADYQALANELVVGAAFITLAWLAYKLSGARSLIILAMAFIGHGVYDIIHFYVFTNPVAPGWWPEFCGTIDIVLGLYMLWLANLNGKTTLPAQ
jgi:hypothetical protein